MLHEPFYRASVVVVLIVTMSITVYYRLQAAKSGERISHREEGYLFAAVLRLAGVLLWISTLGYLIFPDALPLAMLPLPAWLRVSGGVVGLLAAVLMYWTLSSLGKNLTDTVVTRSEAVLVTQGPYRWVRHPFYVTAALLMAGITLLSAHGLIGLCSLTIVFLLVVRTPKEEQFLCERFGEAYRQYMAQTGRFWPRLSNWRRPPTRAQT